MLSYRFLNSWNKLFKIQQNWYSTTARLDQGCMYLDYQSTTQIDPRVLDSMMPYMTTLYQNPHSTYQSTTPLFEQIIEDSKEQISSLINCQKDELVFTSGGTEGINWPFGNYWQQSEKELICMTQIEHKVSLEQKQRQNVIYCPVDSKGIINETELKKIIANNNVSKWLCTWVNNEIGVIQDIKKLVKIMKEEHKKKNTDNLLRIIVDGAQAVGKIECDIKDCEIDYFTFTAHKIFGPKGIGAVSIKKTGKERMRIKPMIFGGGQQKGTRSGTLAPFLIVGFGKALEIAKKELENDTKHVNNLFNILYDELKALFPNIQLNGDLVFPLISFQLFFQQQRYHGNLNVTIPHFTQKQFQQLSKNIEVSQGAACLLTQEPSYVLKEIYRENHEKLKGLHLRIGLGRFTTLKEIEILVDELTKLKQDFL